MLPNFEGIVFVTAIIGVAIIVVCMLRNVAKPLIPAFVDVEWPRPTFDTKVDGPITHSEVLVQFDNATKRKVNRHLRAVLPRVVLTTDEMVTLYSDAKIGKFSFPSIQWNGTHASYANPCRITNLDIVPKNDYCVLELTFKTGNVRVTFPSKFTIRWEVVGIMGHEHTEDDPAYDLQIVPTTDGILGICVNGTMNDCGDIHTTILGILGGLAANRCHGEASAYYMSHQLVLPDIQQEWMNEGDISYIQVSSAKLLTNVPTKQEKETDVHSS